MDIIAASEHRPWPAGTVTLLRTSPRSTQSLYALVLGSNQHARQYAGSPHTLRTIPSYWPNVPHPPSLAGITETSV